VCSDPKAALTQFHPGKYDLLITDIRMPGMDGFELYKQIKQVVPDIKVCDIRA
jgi:YesN/AraC family two-component response regulator